MRLRTKLILVALTASALFSLAVGSASARRLELSNQRFLAIWTLIRFEVEGTSTVECPLTLEGSFHSRTLSKMSGQLIGYVTRAFLRGGRRECNETGTATVRTELLPWHIRYDRFIGALPNITGIRIQVIGLAFELLVGGSTTCLIITDAAHPGFFIWNREAGGRANTLTADATATIPFHAGGGFLCQLAGSKRLRGTAEVFLQGSLTTRINVRLVQ